MRILVIGGNGFIGAPLVDELLRAGHQMAVLHRGTGGAGNRDVLEIIGDRNRLQDCEAAIREFAPQVLIDLILSSGQQAEGVVALARAQHARLVAVSSMDVYRAWGVLLGSEPGELEPLPITEDSALRIGKRGYPPESAEALKAIFTWITKDYDKVAVEEAVMRGTTENTVMRLPMVYGPGDPLHRMHGFLKRIADARPAIILAEGHAGWRGPRGYVENVAHAIALTATAQRAPGRIYHVCDEPSLSELEWAKQIAAVAGWGGRFVVMPNEKTPKHLITPFNAAQHLVADSRRIRSELGYEEPVPFTEGIRRTITWEEANPPTGHTFHQFDYDAEDVAALSAYASVAGDAGDARRQ